MSGKVKKFIKWWLIILGGLIALSATAAVEDYSIRGVLDVSIKANKVVAALNINAPDGTIIHFYMNSEDIANAGDDLNQTGVVKDGRAETTFAFPAKFPGGPIWVIANIYPEWTDYKQPQATLDLYGADGKKMKAGTGSITGMSPDFRYWQIEKNNIPRK